MIASNTDENKQKHYIYLFQTTEIIKDKLKLF